MSNEPNGLFGLKPEDVAFKNVPNKTKAFTGDGDSVIGILDYISSTHVKEHVQRFCHSVEKS